jgi:glycosyltransferase involved in cell wall biosynthesis
MRTVRVTIDAMGNAAGGGRTVLNRCLSTLMDHVHVRVHVLCVHTHDLSEAWRTHPRITWEPQPRAASALGRVWWYTTGMREAVGDATDVLLSLNAMGSADVPQINLIQQPMLQANDGLVSQPWSFARRMMMVRALTTSSCQRAQAVVVQTPSMEKFAKRELGLQGCALHALTPDVPSPPRSSHVRRANQILYVGHNQPYKNVARLVEAVGIARNTCPGLTLTTTTHTDHVPPQPWWHAIGPQSREQLHALYATSTALALPSLTETVGLPMLEAMAAGLPVLASDRDFAHDVCGTTNAHFVNPLNSHALARGLLALTQHDAYRSRLANLGRARVLALQKARPYEQLVELILHHI